MSVGVLWQIVVFLSSRDDSHKMFDQGHLVLSWGPLSTIRAVSLPARLSKGGAPVLEVHWDAVVHCLDTHDGCANHSTNLQHCVVDHGLHR